MSSLGPIKAREQVYCRDPLNVSRKPINVLRRIREHIKRGHWESLGTLERDVELIEESTIELTEKSNIESVEKSNIEFVENSAGKFGKIQ